MNGTILIFKMPICETLSSFSAKLFPAWDQQKHLSLPIDHFPEYLRLVVQGKINSLFSKNQTLWHLFSL